MISTSVPAAAFAALPIFTVIELVVLGLTTWINIASHSLARIRAQAAAPFLQDDDET